MSRAESKIASSLFPKDDWRSVSDPNEQRKIQNRLAQQNFRVQARLQRIEAEHSTDNPEDVARLARAYTLPLANEVDADDEPGSPKTLLTIRQETDQGNELADATAQESKPYTHYPLQSSGSTTSQSPRLYLPSGYTGLPSGWPREANTSTISKSVNPLPAPDIEQVPNPVADENILPLPRPPPTADAVNNAFDRSPVPEYELDAELVRQVTEQVIKNLQAADLARPTVVSQAQQLEYESHAPPGVLERSSSFSRSPGTSVRSRASSCASARSERSSGRTSTARRPRRRQRRESSSSVLQSPHNTQFDNGPTVPTDQSLLIERERRPYSARVGSPGSWHQEVVNHELNDEELILYHPRPWYGSKSIARGGKADNTDAYTSSHYHVPGPGQGEFAKAHDDKYDEKGQAGNELPAQVGPAESRFRTSAVETVHAAVHVSPDNELTTSDQAVEPAKIASKLVSHEAQQRALKDGKPDLADAIVELWEQSLVDGRLAYLMQAVFSESASVDQLTEFQLHVHAAKTAVQRAKQRSLSAPEFSVQALLAAVDTQSVTITPSAPNVGGLVFERPEGVIDDPVEVSYLEQVISRVFAIVLGRFASQVAPGNSRIKWSCSCGQRMYGDYSDSDAAAILRLERNLNQHQGNADRHDTSLSHFVGFRRRAAMLRLLSKFEVGPIRGLAAFCCRLLVHTAVTHTEPSATGHPTSSPAALAGRPAPSRTAHPSQKSVQAPTTGPAAPNPLKQTALLLGQIQGTSHATAPAFFELCVNQSKHLVSLGEIQLRDAFGNAVVGNDIELFGKIRQRYDGLRRKGLYSLLYRPADIHFVRFAAHKGGRQTGIYEAPLAIPPKLEVTEQRYHYYECPLDPLPPIDRRTFFHYFWDHASHPPTTNNGARDMLFYNRLPKKLNNSILHETDPDKIYGWGVHIIEGPNKPLLAWCVTAILIVSFLVALVYDVVVKVSDSGFGIGQWMVAVLGTALAATYFHLEDAA